MGGFFFFFQAEDGIRDYKVTGVQTCALPICYDLLVQAMSGLMSITGRADSEPGGGPLRVGVAVIDLFTGMYATTAILGAGEARHHTGRGQHIDMALLDVAMAVLANQGAGFLKTGPGPGM